MSEEEEGSGLDPREALARVDEAMAEEASLRTRTEGLTWIVLGLVTAGITLSYDAAYHLNGGTAPPWVHLVWVPWFLLATALTSVVWRSAALSSRDLQENRQGGLLVLASYATFVAALWAVVTFLRPQLSPDTVAALALGGAWLSFGLANPFDVTSTGRRVMVAHGVVILASGVLLAATLPSDPGAANRWGTAANLVVAAGAPIAGGMWQTTRG